MTTPLALAHFYRGWDLYQRQLAQVIEPLTAQQLTLRAAPQLRTIREQITHIVAVRARWLLLDLHEGAGTLETYCGWDGWSEDGVAREQPARTASEIVSGLNDTWQVMQGALDRWTADDLDDVFPPAYPGEESFTRQYVIWHLIEHDLHHGGELSFVLGMHGLAAIDL